MNLGKLGDFAIGIVIAAAIAGNLDTLNRWVQVATAKVLWESRASNWGSPRFWPENHTKYNKTHYQQKEVRLSAAKTHSN